MNIIEQTEALKDLPDQRLMQEMQAPTGFAPQFLVLSELKRRKRMRDEYQRQQAADMKTVAEETITAAGVPQGGIMQMSRAMNPNSSIAQNTGMDQAPQMQPTRMADGGVVKMQTGGIPMYMPSAAEALQARPGAMTGGLISAIASLKVNYPDLYEQYKDSPQLAQIAEAARDESISAITPELTGLEQMEEGRSFDTLRSLFTDPSNRAVTRQALETEAMQSEINAAAEAQRNAALASGAYDSDAPYVEDVTNVIGRPDNPVIVDPAEIAEAQFTRSPMDESFYGGEAQYTKRLNPRDTEGYSQGTGMGAVPPDRLPRGLPSGEQSFVLQRPEGAPLNLPSTMGGDMPSGIDASTFKTFDVRSSMGDVYADPAKIRAAEDAALSGIGSLGGALTMDEAAAAAARQRIESPTSTQVEQPMLVDQMATASIEDESPMLAELARQAEIKRMMEINEIPEPSPEAGPISSALVDLGEAGIEGLGSSFEAGVDALQSLTEGGDGMPEPTPESALPEGFTLGDGTTAEGALSFGEMLSRPEDTSTAPAGKKDTGGQKASATSSLGGIEGRIAQMLEDKEKNAQSDKWMALAQAGMALMSSKEPTLAGAIGEAGLVGVGALKKGKAQYDKDVLDLLTLQQRIDAQKARASSKSGGLTASNMISLMDDLRNYKGDIQDRIDALNDPTNLMSEEEKAAQLQRLQAELMRTDIELGTYRNALRGGGSTTTPIDVRGGSQNQSSVGYSLGTATQ